MNKIIQYQTIYIELKHNGNVYYKPITAFGEREKNIVLGAISVLDLHYRVTPPQFGRYLDET